MSTSFHSHHTDMRSTEAALCGWRAGAWVASLVWATRSRILASALRCAHAHGRDKSEEVSVGESRHVEGQLGEGERLGEDGSMALVPPMNPSRSPRGRHSRAPCTGHCALKHDFVPVNKDGAGFLCRKDLARLYAQVESRTVWQENAGLGDAALGTQAVSTDTNCSITEDYAPIPSSPRTRPRLEPSPASLEWRTVASEGRHIHEISPSQSSRPRSRP